MLMRHLKHVGSWPVWFFSILMIGCTSYVDLQAISSEERGLKELAQEYRSYHAKNRRAPRSLKELKIQGQRDPMAVTMINSGDLVVRWGTPLSVEGASKAVLAYVKSVPERGGYVLMQDGETIRNMTAEDFARVGTATSK
jgi:hypothetical protein